MPNQECSEFRYDGSPFFLEVDGRCLAKILQRTDTEKMPADYIICEELGNYAFPLHMMRLFNMMSELTARHKMTTQDLVSYNWGLSTPLALARTTLLIALDLEDKVAEYIHGIMSINMNMPSNIDHVKYGQYLLELQDVALYMMQETNDIRSLVVVAQERPFNNSIYFRLGVKAYDEILVKYVVEVAAYILQKRRSQDSEE